MVPISVGGRRLDVSPVFDTYWRFASARQAVYEARLKGRGAPWTDDPVIAEHRFTNVYRASDRVSQYLITDVIYDDDHSPEDTVFRILLFKFFNRIGTWRGLETAVGEPSWSSYDRDIYVAALDRMSARGPIYSAAYVIPPPRFGGASKHQNHLRLLESMMENGIVSKLQSAVGLSEAYETLLAYPSIGPFLAFQFAIDLNYSPVTDFDENDHVVAGPGAIDGIRKCFGAAAAGREAAVIRYMVDSQEENFARRGLPFSGLFGRSLHLIDAQNLFCEVDKYARVVHPQVSGRSGRSRIKQKFRPELSRLTSVFPPKWGLWPEREGAGVHVNGHDALFVIP
jgi:hypothetical protein